MNKGFTLIEIIISLVILQLVLIELALRYESSTTFLVIGSLTL